jgi:hypothetical protein
LCQALDTALVAPAAGSTTPTSDGARGMSVEAVRCARRLSVVRTRRSSIQVHAGPDLDRPKRMRTANMTFIAYSSRTGEPPAGPHLGARSIMGQPKAQGQRSIQIDGLRVPCVSLQTAGGVSVCLRRGSNSGPQWAGGSGGAARRGCAAVRRTRKPPPPP